MLRPKQRFRTRPYARLALVLALLALGYLLQDRLSERPRHTVDQRSTSVAAGDAEVLEAFSTRTSGRVLSALGVVDRILPDDEQGDRHQRFILRLASGHTLLISHNIDLATRVPAAVGDTIEFRGQYEWNELGGVIHWTHHDPQGRRPGGWLRHAGRVYR